MVEAKRARKAETPTQPSSGLRMRAPEIYPDRLRRRSRVILKPAAAGQSRRKHPHECGRVQLTRSAAGGIGSAPHVLAFFLTGRTGGQNQALTDAEGDGAEGAFPWQLQSLRVEGVVLGGSPMVPAGGRVKSVGVAELWRDRACSTPELRNS